MEGPRKPWYKLFLSVCYDHTNQLEHGDQTSAYQNSADLNFSLDGCFYSGKVVNLGYCPR